MKTINLKLNDGEYLGSLSDDIFHKTRLEQAGCHLVSAGTGYGKSTLMLSRANDSSDIVIFSMISIKEQQQSIAEANNWHECNIMQLEHFVSTPISNIRQILGKNGVLHIDEIQNIYEASYRSETFIKLLVLINELRTTHTVMCYSGSYMHQFNPIVFDSEMICTFKNKRELKSYSVIHPDSDIVTSANSEDKVHGVDMGTMVDLLTEDTSIPSLFFNNDIKFNTRLATKIREKGGACVTVCSDDIRNKKHDIHKLLDSGFISDVGADVVIATKCMNEGVNVMDDVRIVSTACSPSELAQQFGRARNEGTRVLLCSNGGRRVSVDWCLEKAKELNDCFISNRNAGGSTYDIEKMLNPYIKFGDIKDIEDNEYRRCVIANAVYRSRYKNTSNALDVTRSMEVFGYKLEEAFEFDIIKSLKFNFITKQERIKLIQLFDTLYLDEYKSELKQKYDICDLVIEREISRIRHIESLIINLQIGNNTDVAKVFERLTIDDIQFLSSLTTAQIDYLKSAIDNDKCTVTREGKTKRELSSMALSFWSMAQFKGAEFWWDKRTDSDKLQLMSERNFIEANGGCVERLQELNDLLSSDYVLSRSQFRVYCYLFGWEFDSKNCNGYYRGNADAFVWDVGGLSASEQVKLSRHKKVITTITGMGNFCEVNRVTTRDLVAMKKREIVGLLEQVNW
ncbi:hypothetical protein [Vibrio rarus]|uniref:hypothetical protein n=1 Tax=Vibrio rarus TaxID=413403 RepID=UPI0021C3BCE9|nr:hypothetical protein [Vibrio rarus]